MNSACCDVKPGERHDLWCPTALCDGPEHQNALACGWENGKKHKPTIYVPEVVEEAVPADFGGLGACAQCIAPAPREATWGWLACVHQIELAEGVPF